MKKMSVGLIFAMALILFVFGFGFMQAGLRVSDQVQVGGGIAILAVAVLVGWGGLQMMD